MSRERVLLVDAAVLDRVPLIASLLTQEIRAELVRGQRRDDAAAARSLVTLSSAIAMSDDVFLIKGPHRSVELVLQRLGQQLRYEQAARNSVDAQDVQLTFEDLLVAIAHQDERSIVTIMWSPKNAWWTRLLEN